MNRDTGIAIVAYNSSGHLAQCLEAAQRFCDRIVVIDNASQDKSLEEARRFPGVQVIANKENKGFAAAANQGFAALDREFVVLLNPDAILRTSLAPMAKACSRDGVGAAGGKLVGDDGKVQVGFAVRRFPTALSLSMECLGLNRIWASNPVNRRYRCLDLDLEKAQCVDQPAGALLMIRRQLWAALGGFDESFHPLWYEEVDFLKRITVRGYQAYYVPEVVATHLGGHSLGSLPAASRRWYWYDNLLRFSAKHFPSMGFRGVAAAVLAGAIGRVVAGMLTGSEGPGAGYGGVLHLAGKCLLRGKTAFGKKRFQKEIDGERTKQANLTESHTHGL